MSEFFNMGGYAAYVWPAYGVSLIALAALSWLRLQRLKKARRNQRQE